MKKRYNIQYLLALMFTLALVGCSNEDFLTTQSDEAKVMSFSIGTSMEEVASKASTGYRAWKTGDPTTFGVYGIYNQNIDSKANLFDNQLVQTEDDGATWTYSPLKYWADFSWCNTFDFFGYMPYVAGATLTQGTGDDRYKYTLSFPASLPNSVLADVANVPLIGKEPVSKDKIGEKINFQMDQVLAGFNITFQLDDKMSALRDFVITKVEITGAAESLPVSGNVSRTYTYIPAKKEWDAGVIVWSGIGYNASAIKYEVPFVDHGDGAENDPYDATNNTLRVGYSFKNQTSQWGDNFYTIPSSDFTPTISVKYDVTVKDELGNYIKTRENITSTIQFSSSYFTDYASGSVGKVHPIVVKIVPSYLFVLADADQRLGYLVIQD